MNKLYKHLAKKIIYLSFGFFFISCTTQNVVEVSLASDAYNQGRYLTAITYANEVLDKDPSNVALLMIKGKSNLKLSNFSEAILDFSDALKEQKGFDEFYYRSRAYLELNKLEEAASDLKNAIKYDSKNVEALFALGYVQTLLGNNDDALEAYEKVVKIDPSNSKAYVNIGNLKGRMGESSDAIKDFSRAISIKPNDPLAYFNRATEKLIIDDKQGAIEDLIISVSLDPGNINSYFLLSETQMQVKDFKNAIINLDKIIKLDGNNPRAYYLKGTCELSINEKEKACKDLRKAGELGYYDAYELITKNCIQKEKKKSKR